MASNIESSIIAINKRLSQTLKVFGKISIEYKTAKKAVKDYIPSKFIATDGEKIRIVRTSSAMADFNLMSDMAFEMLGDVEKVLKGQGTILKMANRYVKSGAKELQAHIKDIQDAAFRRYLGKVVAGEEELDYELWNNINWDSDFYARGVSLWHGRYGTHGIDAENKYDEIVEKLTDLLKKQLERDEQRATEGGGKPRPLSDFLQRR